MAPPFFLNLLWKQSAHLSNFQPEVRAFPSLIFLTHGLTKFGLFVSQFFFINQCLLPFFFPISSLPQWQPPGSTRLGDPGTPLPVHTTHIADLHSFLLYRCHLCFWWKAEVLILLISHNIPLIFWLSKGISERYIIRVFFLHNITVFLHKLAMCPAVPVHIAACLPSVRAAWFLPLTFSSAKKICQPFCGGWVFKLFFFPIFFNAFYSY